VIHALKTAHQYFEESAAGVKSFEVRRNDRPYSIGDYVALNEWSIEGYTGRCTLHKIIYILSDEVFCKEGFVILGLEPCSIRARSEFRESVHFEIGPPVYDRNEKCCESN